jgi:hypothetical protein
MNAENMNVNSASAFFPNGRDWWAIKNFDRHFHNSKKVKNSKEKQRTYGVPLPWKPCGLRRFTR